MKKIVALYFMSIILSAYVSGQDTVRYGDPWYKFNTMPALQEPTRSEIRQNLLWGTGASFLQEYYNDMKNN